MLTVSVDVPEPLGSDAGANAHVGGTLTVGVIAQVNDTAEAKPAVAVTVITVEVDCPAVTGFGASGFAVSWKPGIAVLVPVPTSITLCGLLEALSVMTRVPELLPTVVGAKVRLMVQLAEGARLPPQLFVCENPEDTAMVLKVS